MPRRPDTRPTRRWPKSDPAPDRHAPLAVTRRPPPALYHEADAIVRVCSFCILEWNEGGWQHDRACILAAR